MASVESAGSAFAQDSAFVSVHDGAFRLGDQPFCYVGTNVWFGAYLGSPGETGDRERLLGYDEAEHPVALPSTRIPPPGATFRCRARRRSA